MTISESGECDNSGRLIPGAGLELGAERAFVCCGPSLGGGKEKGRRGQGLGLRRGGGEGNGVEGERSL